MSTLKLGEDVRQEMVSGSVDVRLPGFTVDTPLTQTSELATLDQAGKVLRAAQQVIFLPHFHTTDALMSGERSARDGIPTIRVGIIYGGNFYAHIDWNLNIGEDGASRVTFDVDGMKSIHANIHPGRSIDIDTATADWLVTHALEPLRDELMLTPVEDE